ncbi:histidinol-phosphate transaminase [Parasulfuritortus cantonensis]|uniref:Histidinol-phosphate aminotransferase n=1 Tax=Parasulfuritortus cantonensis TaxID=2528202 RepID=A0A4R1B5F2_9PROT|nr:histidinol-phosphate transaminase [Parasulfuritortus cantonensis]TCJ11727.1 histidinol-phosphate transaminase [Parasulfuritortus cantonensis]
MNLTELSPAYIRAIAPYQPGKPISELAREMGLVEADIVKLASNENPLGVSPKARAAIQAGIDDLALYPDGNGFALKTALAGRLGIGLDQIVLGGGSNDLLEMVARAFLAPGTSAVYSRHAFAVYALATQAAGAIGFEAPAKDYGHDLDAMLARVQRHTRVVWIANPNNPSGTLLDNDALHRALAAFAATGAVVVLDEAYVEFMDPERRAPSIAWLREFPNLIVVRTFSKAYGLAGLRVGYAACSRELADLLNRVRQPFNVNSLALAAAEAALADDEFLAEAKRVNDAGMAQLTAGFRRLGLDWIASAGNFVAVRVVKEGDAGAIFQALLRKGIIVRPVGAYAMPEYLRVSIGLPEQNERFLAALREILAL